MKTPFKKLKTALLILSSNYSTVLDEVRKSKNDRYRSASAFLNHNKNEEFNIVISNDYLPDVELSKEGKFYWIKYDTVRYCFTEYTLAFQISGKTTSIDIKDIQSKTDMFSLSTTTDFYDLSYTDIVSIREFIESCNDIITKA